MGKMKRGLGEAAQGLNIRKAMRSKLSDELEPPPQPPPGAVAERFDPRVIASKIWLAAMPEGDGSSYEAVFQLRSGSSFALCGDAAGFGGFKPLEQFLDVHNRLLETHHREVDKIEIFVDDRSIAFSTYEDLLEWLGLD